MSHRLYKWITLEDFCAFGNMRSQWSSSISEGSPSEGRRTEQESKRGGGLNRPIKQTQTAVQQEWTRYIHWEVLVPAMMSSVWLDAAALGALVHHLAWFELQAFDEFLCSVSFGHSSLSKNWRQNHDKELNFLFWRFFFLLIEEETLNQKLMGFRKWFNIIVNSQT